MLIYPYRRGSKSVAALKESMSAKVIKLEGSNFKGAGKRVINWGSTVTNEEIEKASVLNPPELVKLATNKLKFFEACEGVVSIPEFTTDKSVAQSWIESGSSVVVRETLTGHSGEGIVFIDSAPTWEAYSHTYAKMYVKYIPKKDEYRVHIVGNSVVDVQRKAKSSRAAVVDWKIRNHHNGFVFVREGVEAPEQVTEQALEAVRTVGLHFGAVDVVWNEYRKAAFVLEVNTAPGLEGQTVDSYASALSSFDEVLSTREEFIRDLERYVTHDVGLSRGAQYRFVPTESQMLPEQAVDLGE